MNAPIELFKTVAIAHDLGLYEFPEANVIIFDFGKTQEGTPVLVTGDGGMTWEPEMIHMEHGRLWKGNERLTGMDLINEINNMCLMFSLPSTKLKDVARELNSLRDSGVLFSWGTIFNHNYLA